MHSLDVVVFVHSHVAGVDVPWPTATQEWQKRRGIERGLVDTLGSRQGALRRARAPTLWPAVVSIACSHLSNAREERERGYGKRERMMRRRKKSKNDDGREGAAPRA